MYAHQVIEDIDKFLNPVKIIKDAQAQKTVDVLTRTKGYIAVSQKFVFSTFDSLTKMFEKHAGKLATMKVFLEDIEDCRLPYPDCWFEFEYSETFKCGIIVHAHEAVSDAFFTTAFYKEIGDNRWYPDPLFLFVRIGTNFDHVPHNILVNKLWEPADRFFDLDAHFERNGRLILSFLYFALNLMACLNIGTQVVYPHKRLQRARQKKGKIPLFKYHTLVIKPVGKRQKALAAQGLWTNILHWSKGHKKRYPPPGLFGKYPGAYWWQPIIRGDKKKGFLEKSYKVETD